jgi:hypothetical protein
MLRDVSRRVIVTALILGLSGLAAAQYPPPMPPGPGPNPPYMPPKGGYSSTGPIIGGVAGGAAAVGGVLYWRHTHAKLEGCVGGDGNKLVSDKDNQTYSVTNKQKDGAVLKPGERLQLVGKKSKDEGGQPAFEVRKTSKDLGPCTATSAGQSGK